MRLSEVLLDRPPDDVLATDGRAVLRVGDVGGLTLPDDASERGVALAMRSPLAALAALLMVDGEVDRLAVLPSDADEQRAVELWHRSGTAVLLTDRADLLGAAGGVAMDEFRVARETGGNGRHRATKWLLTTSGTTGVPKFVQHTVESLTRRIRTRIDHAEHPPQWGLLYDWSRFAGLQVVLQALLSRAVLLAPGPGTVTEQVAVLAAGGCTHLSATPTVWRKLLMTPQVGQLPLRQITLGGEIADQDVLGSLARRFPGARVTHIFASTEAGAAFSVSDGRPGFPRDYLETPPQGVQLAIREGRLHVRNELVAGEYVDGARFRDDDGFVDTGDEVVIDGDRVRFLGRASGVINVGGDKVHPETVETVLLDHPGVAMARVWGKGNPMTGSVVAAEVVPVAWPDDQAAFRKAVVDHCKRNLRRTEVPALVRLSQVLETTGAGKVTR
jgi:acyl-CoA synthetase (AMP-forming)/AMP-acid ligase II